MRNNGVSAGQSHTDPTNSACVGVPAGASVCTRTQGSGSLSTRLDVVRAAEQAAGIVATVCGHVGCQGVASSRVRGVALCPGHAGFAAVRVSA